MTTSGDGATPRRIARGGDERRVPVLRGDDVVRGDLVLDRLAVRGLHPVRERRDEGDERDADHQRRRGRGRAAGVADGVPAREPRRRRRPSAAPAARRPPRSADELGRDHRDAEEEQQHAARDGEQALGGPELVGEHRVAEQESETAIRTSATHGVKRANRDLGSVAPSRTAEIGGTRVARIAGNRPASERDPDAHASETTIVRVAKTRSAERKLDAERAEQRLDALRRARRRDRGRRATRGGR